MLEDNDNNNGSLLQLIRTNARDQWLELVSSLNHPDELDGMTFEDFCDEVRLNLPETFLN